MYGIRTKNVYGFRTRFLIAFGFQISVFEIRWTESVQNCGRNPYTIFVRNPYTFCVRMPYTGGQNASGLIGLSRRILRRPNWIDFNWPESPETNDLETNPK